MFILGNFADAAAQAIKIILDILSWLIIVRALISWVNPDPNNPIVQFLYKATEPMLDPIRRILPVDFRFGVDISPIIALLIIRFLSWFIVPTLVDLSARLTGMGG